MSWILDGIVSYKGKVCHQSYWDYSTKPNSIHYEIVDAELCRQFGHAGEVRGKNITQSNKPSIGFTKSDMV